MTALGHFQWRQGLRKTAGVLDAVTLNLLGLWAMGPEIFQPVIGPQCLVYNRSEPLPHYEAEVPANHHGGLKTLGQPADKPPQVPVIGLMNYREVPIQPTTD